MRDRKLVTVALGVALLVVLAVVVGGALMPGATPQASADDPIVLTITGNGQTMTYTLAAIEAMPAYTGYAGMKNSAGTITPPEPVKGVKLSDLLAAVGGMTTLNALDVIATDNYSMPLMYDEAINGNFTLYNADTGEEEAAKSPVSAVLIYERNGAPLTQDDGAPLRLAVCQVDNVNQVADGHWLVKWIDQLTVRAASAPWTVKMFGLKRADGTRQTYTLDRASYFSCAAPGCHGSTWVNPISKRSWSGVPLFLIIGKVDGGKQHDYGAYNEARALKGYRIKLVSASGAYVIIGSRTIINRARIVLANKFQGVELSAKYYPLRLVGPRRYVPTSKYLGRITKIVLLPK